MRKMLLTGTRRLLAVSAALLFWSCSEVTAPPTISRVTFERHTAALWAPDVLATSVTVSRTDGAVVANPAVTYTSSDPLVASVDSTGTVYAHVAGQAAITAAVGSITDELTVTVLWPPVTQVFFADDSLVAFVGDTISPGLSVLNAKGLWATNATLLYSSSAPSTATAVSSSRCCEVRIAAVAQGRAVITVTAERISDFLTVIVKPR